jgi:hypothetical protein
MERVFGDHDAEGVRIPPLRFADGLQLSPGTTVGQRGASF